MSSGTKVALVALLVLVIVVIARLVDDEATTDAGAEPTVGEETDRGAGTAVAARSPVGDASSTSTPVRSSNLRPNAGREPRLSAEGGVSRRSGRSDPRSAGASLLPAGQAGKEREAPVRQGEPIFSPQDVPPAPATSPPTGAGRRERALTPPVAVNTQPNRSPPGSSPLVESTLEDATRGAGALLAAKTAADDEPGRAGVRAQVTPAPARSPSVGIKRFDSESSKRATSGPSFPLTYTIQSGDSPWKIAERFYGTGALHPHISRQNPGVKIHPGKKLIIPAPPAAIPTDFSSTTRRRYGNLPTSRSPSARARPTTYTVKKGETLWEIARRMYGDPTKYVRIEAANPQLRSPADLKAGSTITIP